MTDLELETLLTALKNHDQYRVIERYKRPESYNAHDSSCKKFIGVFIDVETTGLSYLEDKIIELAMVRFEYSADGRLFRILDDLHGYQDPGITIPENITRLTGITDEMVVGKTLEQNDVEQYLADSNLIVAHNAQFDRGFFEARFPILSQKPWACSMNHVDWRSERIESNKLEYIAYRCGFFYEGHRATEDCLAGIHILSKILPGSQKLAFTEVLENCRKLNFKLSAIRATYEHKDLLKNRGYQWEPNIKVWSTDLDKDQVQDEIDFLRANVYNIPSPSPVPTDMIKIFDAYTRYSNVNIADNSKKYQDELDWIRTL